MSRSLGYFVLGLAALVLLAGCAASYLTRAPQSVINNGSLFALNNSFRDCDPATKTRLKDGRVVDSSPPKMIAALGCIPVVYKNKLRPEMRGVLRLDCTVDGRRLSLFYADSMGKCKQLLQTPPHKLF